MTDPADTSCAEKRNRGYRKGWRNRAAGGGPRAARHGSPTGGRKQAMNRMTHALHTALLASSLALSACTTEVGVPAQGEGGKNAQGLQQAFTRFPDLSVPEGADIDLDRTLVFGAGEDWFGRLVIGVSHSANDMFDYFKRELPRFGWEEVTSVRSTISVLTYTRQERVATIQIEGAKFRGSRAVITVSPRGRPQPPAAPPAAAGATGKLPLKKIR